MAVLNDACVEDVLQHLAGKITEVSFAFNAQAISQSVQCFDYNPKCFRDWVIQMKLGNLLAYRFRQLLLVDFSVDLKTFFLFDVYFLFLCLI